jgi:cell division protein FtsB
MDQPEHIEIEPATTAAPVPTPVLEPTPTPKKKPIGKIIFFSLAAIVFLGLIGYTTYGVLTINELNDKVSTQNTLITKLQADNSKLTTENKTMNDQAKAATKTDTTQSTATVDPNFVALAPDSGFMSSTGKTTFTWTAHQNATKYVVEIKSLGQASYPSTYLDNQTVVVDPTAPASAQLSLTKTLASGNYVWRVTAIETMTGHDMVLQSTTDRNYQVAQAPATN